MGDLQTNTLITGALQQNEWAKGAKSLGNISGIASAATSVAGAAAPLFGAEAATINSGATDVLNMAGDVASAFGPIGSAIGAGLKIIGMVNQFAGKKSKAQGTAGMTSAGYATQTSALAGQKADLFTTLFNKKKMKGINQQTVMADASNVKASNASYLGNQNSQLANNSYWDIQTKNQQALQGGLNTKVLSAKKGGNINPKALAEICKLVEKKAAGGDLEINSPIDGIAYNGKAPINSLNEQKLRSDYIQYLNTKFQDQKRILGNKALDPAVGVWNNPLKPTVSNFKSAEYQNAVLRGRKLPPINNNQIGTNNGLAPVVQVMEPINHGSRPINADMTTAPPTIAPMYNMVGKQFDPYPAFEFVNNENLSIGQPKSWNGFERTPIQANIPGSKGVKACSSSCAEAAKKSAAEMNPLQRAKLSKHQLGGIIKSATKTISPNPNVIPDGSFHSRKNNLPEELNLTDKGIPVVSINGESSDLQEHLQAGGTLTQHAEIERNEIIFNITNSKLFEELFNKYKKADKKVKKELEIEAGKVLTQEILDNTIDNTNLLKTLENA